MKIRTVGLVLLALQSVAALAQDGNPLLTQKVAKANPGDVRIMVTAAILGPLEAVRAQAEKAVGKPLLVEYGSARGNLKNQIGAGEEFEVSLLLPDVDKSLAADGRIESKTYPIAQVPIALALRGDVPAPDVSTPEALKASMLKAKAVRYGATGAARDTVEKILSTLGIAGSINDVSKLDPFGKAALAPGEYEISIFPLSEILSNKSLKNLGLVPAPLQIPAIIEAAIGTHANDRKAAEAFIRFLQGPAIDAALKQNGMTKVK